MATTTAAARTTTQRPAAATQLQALRFARGAFMMLLDGLQPDRLLAQAGSCINHPLWIMGHLAMTDDWVLNTVAPRAAGSRPAIPESWSKLFGSGSKPTSDARQYPPAAEVKKAFDDRRAALLSWVESLTAEQLARPTSDGWQTYAPTIGDIAPFIAWHEGYHSAQLAALRKALGLPAAFG
jgi:hypothetical protein